MIEALRKFIEELIAALGPLVDATQDPEEIKALLADLGWNVNSAPEPFRNLAVAGSELVGMIGSDPETISTIQALDAVKRFLNAINALQNAAFPAELNIPAFKTTIGRDLLDYFLVEHLLRNRHQIGGLLKLAGLIRLVETPASGMRQAYLKRQVAWSKIGALITDPAKGFREAFDWNSATPNLVDALGDLTSLFESNGLSLSYFVPESDLLKFINDGATVPQDEPFGIDLAFDDSIGTPDGLPAGIQLLIFPPIAGRGEAIALLPHAQLKGTQEVQLSDDLSLSIRSNADFARGIAIVIRPGPSPQVSVCSGFIGGSAIDSAQFQIGLKITPKPDQPERILIGAAEATRLAFKTAGLSFGVQLVGSNQLDVFVATEINNARVVIKPAPDEADSFLARLMGKEGLAAEFSFGLRFSNLTGFHLTGSGGLEASFPIHINLGIIDFKALMLGLKIIDKGIQVEAGATISGAFGPLTAAIEGAGFKLKAQFPDTPTGNLGPVDLGFGFLPPKGVGLSIDASAVKGGGYLHLDPDKGEYSGALELTVGNFLTLKAFGLISTRMPDGSKGFSLLIIIISEFNPGIQLGYGFVLLGVGGLLGLNRTMKLEPLVEGVRTGSINNIMFPNKDMIVANAQRIISDLQAFFPPMENRFLIGPMAKLGWGTPPLISASLGIIFEIPGNIAILGVLKATLPNESAPLLVLQVNFIGAIEFDKKRIYFFASLFESRVLFITISGEMGLLMAWGEDANFVLSVGGFHPQFNPPPLPFPTPQRVCLNVLDSDNARIRVMGYFAVTSNTVQFGARAELYFGFSAINLSGHMAFDALIQFSPFYFIVQISCEVSLKVFGLGLFSISLQFSLEGPTPWRAIGHGSISFLFFEISASFDITWGESRDTSLPLIDVMPILKAEFEKMTNWTAQLPKSNNLLVSLRKLDENPGEVILHPAGTLRVSQRAIPLDIAIDKVGSQKVNDAKLFRLVPSGDLAKLDDTWEQFALAQYLEMDNADKLSLAAFDPMHGGLLLSIQGEQLNSSHMAKRIVRFEIVIIDSNYMRFVLSYVGLPSNMFTQFLNGNSVALSPLSSASKKKAQPFDEKIQIKPELYTITFIKNNKAYQNDTKEFKSLALANEYLRKHALKNPKLAEQLHVIPDVEVNTNP